MPFNLFYTMVQKSQKWPKTQIKGGPALKEDWSVVVEVSKLGSLHTFGESCLISHVWWILSQTTFWMDLRGRRLIYVNS